MDQDPRIDQILAITKDTNRMVHKMRRGLWYGRILQAVWWIAILAISGYTYYTYAQPYVNKLEELYAKVQQGTQQAQNLNSQVSSFFGNFLQQRGATGTTTATTTKH